MAKSIEQILEPKPEARPRIYAYSITDQAHAGLLKVGQTTRDVKQRIAEQLKTAAIKNYKIELDESAERDDGSIFSDHELRAALVAKGFENTELEWMRCSVEDVKTALAESSLIVAAPRFHAALAAMLGASDHVIGFPSPLADLYPKLEAHKGQKIIILATGDPLWFGIGASLINRFGADACLVIPHVSGLQMAAARMGWPIASCKILTIHGRAIDQILPSCQRRARLLVIAENGQSAPQVAQLLTEQGYGDADISALAHLGGDGEASFHAKAADWQHQVPDFHILAISCPDRPAHHAGFALVDADIENDGKLTKADSRASAVAKLRPFAGAVMWDVGAGSGAVAIEFMRLAPQSRGFAIDKNINQIDMARRDT